MAGEALGGSPPTAHEGFTREQQTRKPRPGTRRRRRRARQKPAEGRSAPTPRGDPLQRATPRTRPPRNRRAGSAPSPRPPATWPPAGTCRGRTRPVPRRSPPRACGSHGGRYRTLSAYRPAEPQLNGLPICARPVDTGIWAISMSRNAGKRSLVCPPERWRNRIRVCALNRLDRSCKSLKRFADVREGQRETSNQGPGGAGGRRRGYDCGSDRGAGVRRPPGGRRPSR